MIFLKLLTVILLGTYSTFQMLAEIVYIAGLWAVFVKCGMPGWRALIPCYREYSLGECVNMEAEGMACLITSIVMTVMQSVMLFLPEGSIVGALLGIVDIAVAMIFLIYIIRIYRNVCDLFRIKPHFLLFWRIFDFIVFPVLGFSKKYRPAWQWENTRNDANEYFSGTQAEVLEAGLTVNLKKRTAHQFLKTKTLLRDIHMDIKPGHMVLLLGGSGAGKTTLLDAIIGYEKADAQIMLNGENVYAQYRRMQYEIGYVPQLDLMRGQDTVYHTLMDAAALRLPTSFSWNERRERVEQVMQIFGLTPSRDTMVDKMSGGQRKRLSIAMEFIPNPSLFILDEPDSGLDGVMARELMQQLRNIADQGKIVMVITHTPDRVIDLFDDVIVLAKDSGRSGRLAYFGPVSDARTFFAEDSMEGIVKCINNTDVGGKGLADEFIKKYAEVQHG